VRSYNPDEIDVQFDDGRLVADAGLILPATLAVGLGLRELLGTQVDLGEAPGRANVADKAMTLLHSALAGGSWIDDCDRLRAGSTGQVLGHRVLAPSTIGTFLRSFRFGHARQLDAVNGQALARAWQHGAGPGATPLTIDVDATSCEVYGPTSRGPRLGTQGARLPPAAGVRRRRLGAAARPAARRQRLHRPRAAGLVAETIGRVRAAGATGPLTLRADAGFSARTVVAACQRHGGRFSITAKLTRPCAALSRSSPRTPGRRSRTGWRTAPTWPRPATGPSAPRAR
jgi:Transposase DDE domain group 1